MKTKSAVLSLGLLLAALLLPFLLVVPVRAAAPIINNQTLTITENSPNGATTSPNKVAAIDPEGMPLTFDVLSGDGMGVFSVDSSTGVVTVQDSSQLDYETKTSFTMQVRATDIEPQSNTATITINVIDESDEPPNMEDQSFNVPENSLNGTAVGTIAFTDIDDNDSFTFTIQGGNGSGGGAFQIDSTGKITVKDTNQLNFEATTSFTLSVKIQDEGGQSDTATITINVTNVNEKPNVSDQQFTISEGASNGSTVGTVVATDPENAALTFARTSGSTAFAIHPTSGQVTVADKNLLDFEADPEMTFVVTVTDPGAQTDTATITVNLTEVNDPPKVTGGGIPDVIVNEGAASKVVNLWAAFQDDEDADSELSFLVQSNDNPGLFTSTNISNAAGTLTLNFQPAAAGIANITVRAFDTNGDFVDDTFKVDINDGPVAQGYSNVTVNEDAANTQINLYDGFTDAEQPSSELIYEVIGNTNAGLFSSVSINLPNLVLDYAPDANGQSTITIRATDGGALSAQTSFNVKVNPVNDPPTTSGIANVNVSEDAPDTVIELFKAFDDKEDEPKQLTYEVSANSNAGLFDSVTINNGAATLTLDYKANTSGNASITVKATDKGVPGVPDSNQSVNASFTVTVGGENDKPVLSNFSRNTNEDIPVQFSLNDFESHYSDADGDSLANVRIQSLPEDGTLKLGGSAIIANQVIPAGQLGTLTFVPTLNWDQGSTSFEWNASDGTAYSEQPATVTINVSPANDAPIINNFEKVGQEGVNVLFTQTDFSGVFTDVDGDSLAKVRIESLPDHGTLKLGNNNVTVNQQINVANLGDLRYVPNAFYSGEDDFNWSGSDGSLYSSPAKVTLTINPVNDPPALDLNGGGQGTGSQATFAAGGDPAVLAGQNLTITDVDSQTMQSATIIIVNRQNGNKEILDANTAGTNITKAFNNGSGVLFLTGPDTIANFEKVLKTVTFRIASDVANPNTAVVRDVSFRVNDGGLNSNDAIAKVKVINPRIKITVAPEFQTVAKETTVVFTVTIENTGDVDLKNIEATSAAVPDCNRTFETLAAGEKLAAYACIVSQVTERINNEVVVTALDTQLNTQVTADDEAVVRVLQDIIVDISPAPAVGDTLIKGQNAVFNVTVINPSEADLMAVQVNAFIDFDVVTGATDGIATPLEQVPAPVCDQVIGDLLAGKEKKYSCTIANVQASFDIEVKATGLIDGVIETDDFDIDSIGVLDLTLEAFASPFEILADQPTTVEYSLTLANVSNVPLTLSSLGSSLHGNLLNAGNNSVTSNTCPGLNLTIAEGEVRSCSYEVTLSLQPPALTNVITAVVNTGNKELTVSDEAIVSVADFSPLDVVLGADPASLVAPGGTANLTVQVINNTSTELTLDGLTDSIVGNLNDKGNCAVPTVIPGNGSYSCTYPVTISGKQAGDIVTYMVTAVADAEEASDSVSIPITSLSQVALRLPMVSSLSVAGEPNNSVCTALPISTNQDNFYLADDANDWYRFTLESQAVVKITLSNYLAEGQIVVFTGNCTGPTFIKNNGNYETLKEIDLGESPAGTYYVWVLSDKGFDSVSPYKLRIQSTAP